MASHCGEVVSLPPGRRVVHETDSYHRHRSGETGFPTPRGAPGWIGRVQEQAEQGEGTGLSGVVAALHDCDGGMRGGYSPAVPAVHPVPN